MSAGLAKASAAAWRKIILSRAFGKEQICAGVLQHMVAGKGLLLENQAASAMSTHLKKPQPSTDRRFKAPLGKSKPTHAYSMFCPCRLYTSKSGYHFRSIPVRSLRPRGCRNDRLLSIGEFIRKYPLFRRIKGHPLIPDEANVWVLTAAGEAFFDNLAWLVAYNNKWGVYVGDALNEEWLRISELFCCPEFRNEAPGYDFDMVNSKMDNFRKEGSLISHILQKYCPEVNLPEEFSGYLNGLLNGPSHLSEHEESILISNAALLSAEAAITCIFTADLWLRRYAKYRGTANERALRVLILKGIASAPCGANGEVLLTIIKEDPYLNHSLKEKAQRAKRNEEEQHAKSSEKKKAEKLSTEGLLDQKPVPQVKPLSEEEQEKERKRKESLEQEQMGDDVLGSQMDLYIHGFDPKMKKDKDVRRLKRRSNYTPIQLAEYQRWKLRQGLVVLQKWFMEARCLTILRIGDLLSSHRRGQGVYPEEPFLIGKRAPAQRMNRPR